MSRAYITDIAAFLPNQAISNEQMEAVLGTIAGKPSRARRLILRSNGIQQRYYAVDPETGKSTHNNAQLTASAVKKLEGQHFSLQEMDCLATGTSMADQLMPNHAAMVHGELGTPACEIIATSGVCLSGITALKYAVMGVSSGEYQKAVATGSENASSNMRGVAFEPEVSSKIEQLQNRPELAFEKDFLRWMLSDGAGAALIEPAARQHALSLRVDWIFSRSYANEMDACMYAGAEKRDDGSLLGWREYTPQQWLETSIFSVKQDVKQLNQHIIHYTVERILDELRQQYPIQASDIDWFVPHYSSHYFRDKVDQGMKNVDFAIPQNKWFTNLYQKGNTGSASIYIMLEELFRSGKLQDGEKILCYIPESGRVSSAFMLLTVVDKR